MSNERDRGRESDEQKVARLREQIPATSAGIYLDTAYRGPLPAETAAAMRDADEWELRVGRATEGRDEDFAQRREEARAVIAALIGADPDHIRFTPFLDLIATPTPHVHPNTGALIEPARPDEGWLALDASLSAGAIQLDVNELDADFLVVPSDRWLLGPEGLRAVWVGPRPREAGVDVPEPEVGRTQMLGLARSVGWLEMYVGLPWIYERTASLAARLVSGLEQINGVQTLTPEAHAATVCFRLTAWPTDQLLDELRRRIFAIISATPNGNAIRASVAWFNTEEEIDRFVSAVAEIAQFTPETLPRRKTLEVLD
jgi:selenocysteine lyase/cysteine desulfurase